MVIAGGQAPCALAYALLAPKLAPQLRDAATTEGLAVDVPDTPD